MTLDEARRAKERGDELRRSGDPAGAIACYAGLLTDELRQADARLVGAALVALGHARCDRAEALASAAERDDERDRAIGAYQDALRIFGKAETPREWATAHYSLGDACARREDDKRWSYLLMAKESLQGALEVFVESDYPREFKAAGELLLRVDGAIHHLSLAQGEVVLGD